SAPAPPEYIRPSLPAAPPGSPPETGRGRAPRPSAPSSVPAGASPTGVLSAPSAHLLPQRGHQTHKALFLQLGFPPAHPPGHLFQGRRVPDEIPHLSHTPLVRRTGHPRQPRFRQKTGVLLLLLQRRIPQHHGQFRRNTLKYRDASR